MFSNPRAQKPFIIALSISILVIVSLLATHYVLAGRSIPAASQVADNISPDGNDDSFAKEVAVEWIATYPNMNVPDSPMRGYSCDGFWTKLWNAGWGALYQYGNQAVFERDYKLTGYLGGNENNYADKADINMLCAAGTGEATGKVVFPTMNTDHFLEPTDATDAYGDMDLEWLAFQVSYALNDNVLGDWSQSLNGLHLLLGVKNQLYTANIGLQWAERMIGQTSCDISSSVTQAWFQAYDDSQSGGVCVRVIAERQESYNDYLPGKGWVSADQPVDEVKDYWDHCVSGAGSKELLTSYNQPEVLALPVVQVAPRAVDENYVREYIAPAFHLETAPICYDGESYVMSSDVGGIASNLIVEAETGSFSFHNQTSLWTTPAMTLTLPSLDQADLIVENWLGDLPGSNLPGAMYRNSGFSYMVEGINEIGTKAAEETDLQSVETVGIPANVAMTYPRRLDIPATTSSGIQQVNFQVFGPGGRMNIYLGDQGEIIGAQGGSRDVNILAEMVTILDPDEVWSRYLNNPQLAIGDVGLMADTITHTVPTLGYYEMPYDMHQEELIPVYEFRCWFSINGILAARDIPIYIPAAEEYMPPIVTIESPMDGSTFWMGESIAFHGTVSGGTPPYTIKWSSSQDGILGNALDIVTTLTTPVKEGSISSQQVSLMVTDANGLTGFDMISLEIKPVFWMPLIRK